MTEKYITQLYFNNELDSYFAKCSDKLSETLLGRQLVLDFNKDIDDLVKVSADGPYIDMLMQTYKPFHSLKYFTKNKYLLEPALLFIASQQNPEKLQALIDIYTIQPKEIAPILPAIIVEALCSHNVPVLDRITTIYPPNKFSDQDLEKLVLELNKIKRSIEKIYKAHDAVPKKTTLIHTWSFSEVWASFLNLKNEYSKKLTIFSMPI